MYDIHTTNGQPIDPDNGQCSNTHWLTSPQKDQAFAIDLTEPLVCQEFLPIHTKTK